MVNTDPFASLPPTLAKVANAGPPKPRVAPPKEMSDNVVSAPLNFNRRKGPQNIIRISDSCTNDNRIAFSPHNSSYYINSPTAGGGAVTHRENRTKRKSKRRTNVSKSKCPPPLLFIRGYGLANVVKVGEPPASESGDDERDVAHGLMIAKEWGFFVDNHKPWLSRAKDMELPEDKRIPIDKEDAIEYEKKFGKKPEAVWSPAAAPKATSPTATNTNEVSVDTKAKADDLGLTIPAAGTRIEVAPEVARELAIAVAEANVDDAAKGDKVATLTALLGDTITNAMTQPIDTSRYMARDEEVTFGV